MWRHHSQGWSPRLKNKKWWASKFVSFWSWQIQNNKSPCASATMPHWPQTESLYQLWGGINPSNCCLSDTCHSSKGSDYTCSKAEWTAPWSLGPQNQSPFLLEPTTWVWIVFSTSWTIEILETRAWEGASWCCWSFRVAVLVDRNTIVGFKSAPSTAAHTSKQGLPHGAREVFP